MVVGFTAASPVFLCNRFMPEGLGGAIAWTLDSAKFSISSSDSLSLKPGILLILPLRLAASCWIKASLRAFSSLICLNDIGFILIQKP